MSTLIWPLRIRIVPIQDGELQGPRKPFFPLGHSPNYTKVYTFYSFFDLGCSIRLPGGSGSWGRVRFFFLFCYLRRHFFSFSFRNFLYIDLGGSSFFFSWSGESFIFYFILFIYFFLFHSSSSSSSSFFFFAHTVSHFFFLQWTSCCPWKSNGAFLTILKFG